MNILTSYIIIYIIISVGIGLYASLRVKNSTDYLVAGRSLPIYVVIATVFATWFGSEAVLGMPAIFIESNLGGVVADPFGAGICLILVGLFFARPLYRMKLLTIGDYFRQRYSRHVELLVAFAICVSYLGWIAAQVVALGLVLNLVTSSAISIEMGMIIGILAVMVYTIYGGMWSVVITDFVQMIMILCGLCLVAWLVSQKFDGGAWEVIEHASANNKFEFWPEMNLSSILAFIGTFVTLALGSMPQQDVFQRVMSAKNEKVAVRGTVLGGLFYIIFCLIPIFITYGAIMLHPELLQSQMGDDGDYQRILPEYILNEVPILIQILFFGALLSAIMSTASGTLLAPSAILAENVLKDIYKLNDKQLLRTSRLCVLVFAIIVTAYALLSHSAGLGIFEMVENAYLVTLCGAFVPLAFGVYWSRANNLGALLSIALGVGSWVICEVINYGLPEEEMMIVPPQLIGLGMAVLGMLIGGYYKQQNN